MTVQHTTWRYGRHVRYCPFSVCTPVEVDQGQIATECQALFSATGFIGASEPDDIEDAEEGDILEAAVRPRGSEVPPPEAAAAVLEITEGVRGEPSEGWPSWEPPAPWCCEGVGTYRLLSRRQRPVLILPRTGGFKPSGSKRGNIQGTVE